MESKVSIAGEPRCGGERTNQTIGKKVGGNSKSKIQGLPAFDGPQSESWWKRTGIFGLDREAKKGLIGPQKDAPFLSI